MARTEKILGKPPAIYNGHQPPRADDPYVISVSLHTVLIVFLYLYLPICVFLTVSAHVFHCFASTGYENSIKLCT